MIKILYIVQLPPPLHGASLCNQNVVKSKLINSKFITEIVSLNFSNSLEEMQRNSFFKFFKVIPITINLIWKLLYFRPSVVYFTLSPIGNAFKRDLLFVTLLKMFRCKIVYHLHGKGINDVKSQFINRLYKYTFKNTNVICLSNLLAKDIQSVKSNAEIFICANGVDTENLTITSSSEKINRKIKLLFLSNLLPLKGIKLYLEAATKVIVTNSDIEINIAGPFNDKYTEDDLNSFLLSHPELARVTKVHGSVKGAKKWNLLNDSDVLVHPTFNDAFPLVILEAMAAGCLVVSTKQGGIPDILEGKSFGFILNEVTADCLTEKLQYLLKHVDDFPEWSNDAIQDFRRHYTISDFESRLVEIFETVHEL
jgi:glycosyltransferase involved in cell wall biosynthesis